MHRNENAQAAHRKETVHRTIAKKAKIWNFLDKDFFKNEIYLFI